METKKITLFTVSMICLHTVWDRLEQRAIETTSRDVICYTTKKDKAEEIKSLYSENLALIKEQQVSSAKLSEILDNLEREQMFYGIPLTMWDEDEFNDFHSLFAA